MEPSSLPPTIRQPIRGASPPLLDYEPRAPTDFERQADDIIANFRAKAGIPIEVSGIEGGHGVSGGGGEGGGQENLNDEEKKLEGEGNGMIKREVELGYGE